MMTETTTIQTTSVLPATPELVALTPLAAEKLQSIL